MKILTKREKTKIKLAIAREIIMCFVSIALGLLVFGIGKASGDVKTMRIGMFIAVSSYVFYSIFRISWRWFRRCNRYPLD